MTAATPRPASTVVVLRPSPGRFEVLLVRRADAVAFMGGAHVFPGGRVDEEDAAETMERRHRLAAARELREEAGLHVDADALVPLAHWVTPGIEIRRYDTWFYVTAVPAGQAATHDGIENTDSLWIDPAAALDAAVCGDLTLPPPTWMTLRQLTAFASADEVMAWARRLRIEPVQPAFEERDGVKRLTVPGQPPAQFELRNGRWRAVDDRAGGF
jgi:8-oxo-dGTP pyrophosphatase MutT (NUDIX family)